MKSNTDLNTIVKRILNENNINMLLIFMHSIETYNDTQKQKLESFLRGLKQLEIFRIEKINGNTVYALKFKGYDKTYKFDPLNLEFLDKYLELTNQYHLDFDLSSIVSEVRKAVEDYVIPFEEDFLEIDDSTLQRLNSKFPISNERRNRTTKQSN